MRSSSGSQSPSSLAVAIAAASFAGVLSLAPEKGGTVAASEFRNWSPVYRQRGIDEEERQLGDPNDAQSGYEVLHAKDTQYHRLAVVQDSTSRYLRFDSSFQSGMWRDQPYRTRFEYTDYLQLALAYNPGAKRVLFVGLGGGSAPKRMWRDFPGLRLDVVELDGEVVDVAHRFFGLPRDDRIDVEVEDGRRYLSQNEGPWDAIVIDAFYSDSIPFHLATREFLELARTRLAPGGVIATNVIGAVAGEQSRLLRSMLRTYRTVFPTVAVHPVFESADSGLGEIRNVIFVAGEGAAPRQALPRGALARHPPRCARRARPHPRDPRPSRCADLDRERAGPDRRLRAHRRAAPALRLGRFRRRVQLLEQPPHELREGRRLERLREETEGADAERVALDVRLRLPGHEHERQVARPRVPAQGDRQLEAVEDRHLDVEQEEVGVVGDGALEALAPVGGLEHLMSLVAQYRAAERADPGIVVDDEDPSPMPSELKRGRFGLMERRI